MVYDTSLAERIRHTIESPSDATITERAMFGGLAFLVNGNMAITASGGGGLTVRVGSRADELALEVGVASMEMRGRPMRGWILVDTDAVGTAEQLSRWVDLGVGFAETLPAK